MATAKNGESKIVKFKKLTLAKQYDDLEAAWISELEAGGVTLEDCLVVVGILAKHKQSSVAETLAWYFLTVWGENQGSEAALAAARQLATFVSGGPTIRSETAELYRKALPDLAEVETLLEMTVLREQTPFADALAHMDTLVGLPGGTFVRDCNVSDPGRVLRVDVERKLLIVMLNGQERRYEGQSLGRLEPLSQDEYRALMAFDRDRLEAIAKDNPEQLALMILKEFGPTLRFSDMKDHVTEILGEQTWSSWWSDAKIRLYQSLMIDMPFSTQPSFELRARPISQMALIRQRFESAGALDEQCAMILEYGRALSAGAESHADALKFLADELTRRMKSGEVSYTKLAALAVRAELGRYADEPFPQPPVGLAEVIAGENDLSQMMTPATNEEVARCALTYARGELGGNWKPFFADVLPGCSTVVCRWLAEELIAAEDGHRLAVAAETVVAWPDRYPRATLWLWKEVTSGKPPEFLSRMDGATILNAVLAAAAIIKRDPPFKDAEYTTRVAQQIRSGLSAGRCKAVERILEKTVPERVQCLRESVKRNPGLSEVLRNDLLRVFHNAHPNLFTENVPAWESDEIYTTASALAKTQEKFANLVNVEILANAKSIGEAAARGDLSENAEFTAALEERDRLTERATRMREDLAKAKIIEPGSVSTDRVTIGTKVRAEDLQTHRVETFVFLGPWDSDPNQRIFSYQAPLSLAFMGKTLRQTIEFTAQDRSLRSWKVVEILPAV